MVIGAANAIRGILIGNTAVEVGGLILLGLIVVGLAFGPVVARLFIRVFRRPPGRWWGRVFAFVFAISVLTDVPRGISAIANHDWGSLLFYAVRLPADAVLMTDAASWSRRIGKGTDRRNATAPLRGHRSPSLAGETGDVALAITSSSQGRIVKDGTTLRSVEGSPDHDGFHASSLEREFSPVAALATSHTRARSSDRRLLRSA